MKYIALSEDKYGNIVYLTNQGIGALSYTADVNKAVLVTNEDKKEINKIRKRLFQKNLKYVPLDKFPQIAHSTLTALRDYEHHFTDDAAKFMGKKDEMHKECISYAKNNLDGIKSFMEFGEAVGRILIDKYSLKKMEVTL